jgi:hypothetical protein
MMNIHETWKPTLVEKAEPVSALENLDIEQGVLGTLLTRE